MDARFAQKMAARASGAVEVEQYGAIGPGANVYNPTDVQARFRAKMAARGGVEMEPDQKFLSPQEQAFAALEGHAERLERELDVMRKALRAKSDGAGGKELEDAKAEIDKLRKELDETKAVAEKAAEDAKAEIDKAMARAAAAERDLEQLTKPAQGAAPEQKPEGQPAKQSGRRG